VRCCLLLREEEEGLSFAIIFQLMIERISRFLACNIQMVESSSAEFFSNLLVHFFTFAVSTTAWMVLFIYIMVG
jgi:hypothetical protein